MKSHWLAPGSISRQWKEGQPPWRQRQFPNYTERWPLTLFCSHILPGFLEDDVDILKNLSILICLGRGDGFLSFSGGRSCQSEVHINFLCPGWSSKPPCASTQEGGGKQKVATRVWGWHKAGGSTAHAVPLSTSSLHNITVSSPTCSLWFIPVKNLT